MVNREDLLGKDMSEGERLREAIHNIVGEDKIDMGELDEARKAITERTGMQLTTNQIALIEKRMGEDTGINDIMKMLSMGPGQVKKLEKYGEGENVEFIRAHRILPRKEQGGKEIRDVIHKATGMEEIGMSEEDLTIAQKRIEEMTGAKISKQAIGLIEERIQREDFNLDKVKEYSDLSDEDIEKLRAYAEATVDVDRLDILKPVGENAVDSDVLVGQSKAYVIDLLDELEDDIQHCDTTRIGVRLRALFYEFIHKGEPEGAPMFQDLVSEVMNETKERCGVDVTLNPRV